MIQLFWGIPCSIECSLSASQLYVTIDRGKACLKLDVIYFLKQYSVVLFYLSEALLINNVALLFV